MNTPNTITLTRILMIPLIVFFYLANFIPFGKLVGAILFILACVTDFLDGYIARKNNQVTTLGKFFDTIADKMLVMTGLVLIIAAPIIGSTPVVYPSWLGIVCVILILAREFIISALRQLAASKGIVLAADMSGKVKATAQFVVVSAYMILAFVETDILSYTANESTAVAIVRFVLMIFLIATTFLTIYSGAGYLIRNRKVFSDDNTEGDIQESEYKNIDNETEKEIINDDNSNKINE